MKSVVVLFATALLASGCYDGRGHHGYGPHGGSRGSTSLPACPVLSGSAPQLHIDTDQPFSSDPGSGVAVYIEYLAGGHWSVRPQCDTAITAETCAFEVTAQAWNGATSNVVGDSLESNDAAGSVCADTAFIATETAGDIDRLYFDTAPGATVRFTATLGSTLFPNLFYWMTDGAPQIEAGANPIDLTPTSP